MFRPLLMTLTALLLLLLPGSAWAQTPASAELARGEYLARAADCAACHRTRDTGGAPYAGGYAIESPMGDIIAPNITPSKVGGIGAWSFADFDRAMRKGIRRDGAPLYPAMPYTDYQAITAADMHALYAYFRNGVKPVDTVAPETKLPFPFGIRAVMIPWNWMFRSNTPFTPHEGLSAEARRGQYLVETLGHCGSCHTPRNLLMAERPSHALGGGSVGGWTAPNITADPVSGIGGWSQAEIVTYLRDGHVPGKGVAAGGMAEAVEHSLRHLSAADLTAMAAYLKSVKPIRNAGETRPAFAWTQSRAEPRAAYEGGDPKDPSALADGASTDGAVLYAGACASCHGLNGRGTADGFYPSLSGSTTTGAADPANLIQTILRGVDRDGGDGRSFMPAFANQLTDAQVGAVANHVLARFGRPGISVTADQVATLRAGGEIPLLIRAMPWMLGLGALVFMALAFFSIRRLARGKQLA